MDCKHKIIQRFVFKVIYSVKKCVVRGFNKFSNVNLTSHSDSIGDGEKSLRIVIKCKSANQTLP